MRCARCGEVIGVYEPIIALSGGIARETSRAARLERAPQADERCYHRSCIEPREGDPVSLRA